MKNWNDCRVHPSISESFVHDHQSVVEYRSFDWDWREIDSLAHASSFSVLKYILLY